MRVFRLMAIMGFVLLGAQMLVVPKSADAQMCCNCTSPYGPSGCYACGNCRVRATALLEELGLKSTEFTLKNTKGGGIQVEASQEVIDQLLDMKQNGKIAYGDYIFHASGGGNNLILRCVGFVPIDKAKENRPRDEKDDPQLKKNNEGLENLDKIIPSGHKKS